MLDTGDLSGDPDEAGRLKSRNLLQGMAMIGYDAINAGEKDLADGVKAFRDLADKSNLTFINANFVYRDTGDVFLPPFEIKQYALGPGRTIKVGYLGLNTLNSAFAKETPEGRVVVMHEPAEAAKKYAPILDSKVDLLVLIGNLSPRDLTTVLSAAPQIDLALVSYGPRLSTDGSFEKIQNVPVFYAGDQGKRLGEVRVTFKEKGARPDFFPSHVLLTQRYPSDPKLETLIEATTTRVNEINRQKATAQAAVATAPSSAGGPGAGAAGLTRRDPAPLGVDTAIRQAEGRPFLSVRVCASCHMKEHQTWYESAHSRAFQTLVTANQDYNPECVKCHVTGFAEEEGFTNIRQTPDLANVQCEACHGNATEHLKDLQKPFGKVPPRLCFTCHTKENSPEFVFFKYWEKIKH
ncbi:MAG TPA: multiheme c-type cytochrome [Candidatus Polarisedimenticolia bacterium]|nr:multiheme c-type cytochrome [Candidatus Polarisedimenticolia bacterium]